jgi:hypothetical protein
MVFLRANCLTPSTALAQASDERAPQILADFLRRVGRIGLMNGLSAEVAMLCGPE